MANGRARSTALFGLGALEAGLLPKLATAALVFVLPGANAQTPAQTIDAPAPQVKPEIAKPETVAPESDNSKVKARYLVTKFPDKPSLPFSWTIPLDPLGFSAPGAIYLGSRNALASLDFLDESHLLFTFRVPGLQHRDAASSEESDERQIRAVVLTLPQGAVAAQAQWTLHDRARYLWALKDGRFLLRNRNSLLEGDATLALKPLLDFPGVLLSLSLDPAQKFLVTNSREPVAKPASPAATPDRSLSAGSTPGQIASPSTASASVTTDEDSIQQSAEPDLVVRILRLDSGEVLLVSRVRSAVHLPLNSVGYLENLRGRAAEWILNLSYFTGGSKMLGSVESTCSPQDDFLSEEEILVTGCGPAGESKLVAMTTSGRTLWITQAPPTEIWPQLVVSGNGLRIVWETLDVDHAVNSFVPLDADDVKEQSVTVFDAANGDIALVSPVTPILDAGGNVAISPSGRRVALLNAGAIQVFELPASPPLPADPRKPPVPQSRSPAVP
jgi:hypothetical protein